MTEQSIVVKFSKKLSIVENEANALVINTPDDMLKAVEMLSNINKSADAIREEKEKITKPLNEVLKTERARWSPVENICSNVVLTIRSKMMEYQKRIDEQVKITQEKIMARVEKGTMKVETAVSKMEKLPDAKASVTTTAGMVQWVEQKKMVIFDTTLIPRPYLLPDEVAIRKDLLLGKEIPGAKIEIIKIPKNLR